MLIFIALVATLNLSVGYALGVYIGQFPGLPRRRPAEPPESTIDLASKPAEPKKKKAKPQAKPAAEEQQTPATTTEPPTANAKPTAVEVREGMDAFRAQLAKMSEEMQDSVEDEQAFGDCATRLQQANHEYLEQAQHAIDELDESPEDEVAANCREVVAESAKTVGEASTEIDQIMADGVPDESGRVELISKTNELTQVVAEAEKDLDAKIEGFDGDAPAEEAASEPEPVPVEEPEAPEETAKTAAAEEPSESSDATEDDAEQDETAAESGESQDEDATADAATLPEGLESLEAAQAAIEAALNGDESRLVIATVRRDEADLPDGDSDLESRLFEKVSEIAGELLDDAQTIAGHDRDRLLMVLNGDDIDEATRRVESIRQQIEKTKFKSADGDFKSTVTCAIAQASEGVSTEDLLGQLDEALDESQTAGGNQSYLHDGRFPGPVPPEDQPGVKPQFVQL